MKELNKYISKLRTDFSIQTLDESEVNSNPVAQFECWFKEAIQAEVLNPNAMMLSTATRDAKPSARVVLLKSFNEKGFEFYTNYLSKKAANISENPYVALTFFWDELERQVRIEGTIEKLSSTESDHYFSQRPEGSKLGAWSSVQSSVISSRKQLEKKFNAVTAKFANAPIPRPDYWGGYNVKPLYFEFWQGRANRMHDRIVYLLNENRNWKIERLEP